MNIIILISTPDARGLVHKISSNLLEFNIEKNDEFVDKESGQFFMRTEISVDSAESQNLVNLNSCEAPLNSPASWCKKSESKGAEVPPADFLLEADKRGTPPKSEKAAAFWRVGGAGRGVQPFLRENTSEIDKKNGVRIAESSAESQSGLPRRFCESARNDNFLDSSLRLRSAQNDNKVDCHADSANLLAMTKNTQIAESALDSANAIKNRLRAILPKNSFLKVTPKRKKSLIIFATKESHCLGDLLLKNYNNELNIEIKAVISNHADLGALVGKFHIPYFHISHERADYENEMLQICANFAPDFIVLAKYMRILRPSFIKHYENRIINIHHSFLPAFIGANPYKQAYNRGVKIIGATAHFVTSELDSGPIICQDILQVNHTFSWQDMQKAGRNIERVVLARAVELAIDERIFIHNNKTIIF